MTAIGFLLFMVAAIGVKIIEKRATGSPLRAADWIIGGCAVAGLLLILAGVATWLWPVMP